ASQLRLLLGNSDHCLAANSTNPFNPSGGNPTTFPMRRPLTNTVGVPVTPTDCPSATDCSTRVLVSALAAQVAMSAPFTPAVSAIAVNFSSAFASVMLD